MPALADDGRSRLNVPGLAHISSVATDPERGGEGFAASSLRSVMSQATRRGYARCQLWTASGNAPAQRLYERTGFGSPVAGHQLWEPPGGGVEDGERLGKRCAANGGRRPDPGRAGTEAGRLHAIETASYLGHVWAGRDELGSLAVDGDPVEPDLVPVLARLKA